MNIFPAIDLYEGKAVRLYKGDYRQMTVYDPEPLNTAKAFEAAGAKYLHLVLEDPVDGEFIEGIVRCLYGVLYVGTL